MRWRAWISALLGSLLTMAAAARPLAPGAEELARLLPGAETLEAESRAPGLPPVRLARRGGALAGYVFSSHAVVATSGFSGQPVDVWVALAPDATIAGVVLAEHHEPILGAGVSPERLDAFVAAYRGRSLREEATPVRRYAPISGASISSAVLDDAIMRSARAVARAYGLLPPVAAGPIDIEGSEPLAWAALLDEGSVARLDVSAGRAGAAHLPPDARFVALFAAPLAPARIGRNLLGDRDYAAMMAALPAGAQPLLIAGAGLYSFKGTSFVRSGTFERIAIVQGAKTIRLTAAMHRRLDRLAAAGAPELTELALFTLPAEAGLNLAEPWRVELLVTAEGVPAARFELPYRLPARYATGAGAADKVPTLLDLFAPAPAGERPLWQRAWQAVPVRIGVLAGALFLLTALLFVQDWLVRRRTRHRLVRLGFLAFTLGWLGWYAGAQLSVVNVLTFVNAVLGGFRWEFFLVDPMAFILWSAMAAALLFLGRGVYCGWLCPFGALQEFVARLAERLRLPQWRVPFLLHERLWPFKYVLLLGLVALSLQSLEGALPWTEVEPFKAAIALGFARPPHVLPWLVLYLALLFVAGLFVERFFCRYVCPLGAALAIPARLRMFEWLRRRPSCGTQCQICASRCPVQAIHPDGRINPNECIHCLGCQVLYYDDTTCPPLIERRKRREARRSVQEAA